MNVKILKEIQIIMDDYNIYTSSNNVFFNDSNKLGKIDNNSIVFNKLAMKSDAVNKIINLLVDSGFETKLDITQHSLAIHYFKV